MGRVLRRPAFAPLPGFVVRIIFGELARPLLLEGQKVHPRRLIESGFEFEHPNLEDAFERLSRQMETAIISGQA